MSGRRKAALAIAAGVLVTLVADVRQTAGQDAVAPPDAQVQERSAPESPATDGATDRELLEAARAAEAAGDIERAERLLRELHRRDAGSLTAVLSLERLLRAQGRLKEVLPLVERVLADEPASPIAHQLALRTLSAMDRLEALRAAERRWIDAAPEQPTPYREAARIWTHRGQHDEALRVLRDGRERLGDDALAYELGAVHARMGHGEPAVAEWQSAIGRDASGFAVVRRGLLGLPDGGASLTPALVEALSEPPTTVERVRAALVLAVGAGMEEDALGMARRVASMLEGAERSNFLLVTARAADSAREHHLAYWAYRRLAEDGWMVAGAVAPLRRRMAELAAMLGDSVTARQAYARMADEVEPGSVAARAAAAARLELMVGTEPLEETVARYERFRASNPGAPELERLAAALSARALEDGRGDLAEAVIEEVPGALTSAVRARLALSEGDPGAARAAMLEAAAGLEGAEATRAILLATVLDRATPAGARRLALALARLDGGEVEDAIDTLTEGSVALEPAERSAMLEFAAGVAEREGMELRAESIRRMLLEAYPQSLEAPSALLGLARALAQRPGELDEARTLVERLILEHPRSALVPQARRLLAQLQESAPRS